MPGSRGAEGGVQGTVHAVGRLCGIWWSWSVSQCYTARVLPSTSATIRLRDRRLKGTHAKHQKPVVMGWACMAVALGDMCRSNVFQYPLVRMGVARGLPAGVFPKPSEAAQLPLWCRRCSELALPPRLAEMPSQGSAQGGLANELLLV